jgi:hypothetical protein
MMTITDVVVTQEDFPHHPIDAAVAPVKEDLPQCLGKT